MEKKKRIKSFMRNKMRYLPEKVCKDKSINKCEFKINKLVDLEEKMQSCQKKKEKQLTNSRESNWQTYRGKLVTKENGKFIRRSLL